METVSEFFKNVVSSKAVQHGIAAVRLLILTAARLLEILDAQLARVDLEQGVIFLADSRLARSPCMQAPLLNANVKATRDLVREVIGCAPVGRQVAAPASAHDWHREGLPQNEETRLNLETVGALGS